MVVVNSRRLVFRRCLNTSSRRGLRGKTRKEGGGRVGRFERWTRGERQRFDYSHVQAAAPTSYAPAWVGERIARGAGVEVVGPEKGGVEPLRRGGGAVEDEQHGELSRGAPAVDGILVAR